MYKKMRCVYLHMCLAILQTHNLGGSGCKAYQNLVLNGTGPLKLLHLYGDFDSCRAQTGMSVCILQL